MTDSGYTAPGPVNFDRQYTNNGATLKWGEDLSEDTKQRLLAGEVFTLLDPDGVPIKRLFLDPYNQLREMSVIPR